MHDAGPRRLVVRDQRPRGERGSSAVEMALVLPMLVMLLMGTVTTGLSYSRALGVSNAVREGARFGATAALPTAPAPATPWGTDAIAEVRGTQFDDFGASPETAVCVQLYKVGTGPVPNTTACDQGNGSVSPALSMPGPTNYPVVPTSLASGVCVVRVLAARNYTVDTAMTPAINRTMTRGSVARYERTGC